MLTQRINRQSSLDKDAADVDAAVGQKQGKMMQETVEKSHEEVDHKQEEQEQKMDSYFDYTPLRQLDFLYKMFFTRKFIVHRLVGLSYLLQYVLVGFYYFYDYKGFLDSWLLVTLPLTGVFQSVTAIYTV